MVKFCLPQCLGGGQSCVTCASSKAAAAAQYVPGKLFALSGSLHDGAIQAVGGHRPTCFNGTDLLSAGGSSWLAVIIGTQGSN